jgi:hypothetical protein
LISFFDTTLRLFDDVEPNFCTLVTACCARFRLGVCFAAADRSCSMSSRRRSRPGTPASFNAPPSGRRTPLGALQQNNAGASAPLRLGGRACCSALRCLCRAAVAPAPLGSANRTLTAVNARIHVNSRAQH